MRKMFTLVVLAAVALSARGAAAADVPTEVQRTHSAVRRNARDILKIAYPTAQGMNGATDGTWSEQSGGYALDEKFDYNDSDGDAQSFTLHLRMDRNGSVKSVSVGQRSELWPPFGTGNLLLAVVKAAAQKQVDDARQAGQDPPPAALLMLKATDITDVVVVMLNIDR